jgi:hypothetical protein
MRLSMQMEKILLTLLKAEEDLELVVGGPVREERAEEPRLELRNIAVFICGPEILYADGKHVIGHIRNSFGRSIKRLREWGYIDSVHPGGWGFDRRVLYHGLTAKGREEAEILRNRIRSYIDEYARLL